METTYISEQSTMVRYLCVRLAGFGDGLEREISTTLEFMPELFSNEGIVLGTLCDIICSLVNALCS